MIEKLSQAPFYVWLTRALDCDGLALFLTDCDWLWTQVFNLGLPFTLLDANQVREMEPNILPSIIPGIHYPDDAQLIPHRFVGKWLR